MYNTIFLKVFLQSFSLIINNVHYITNQTKCMMPRTIFWKLILSLLLSILSVSVISSGVVCGTVCGAGVYLLNTDGGGVLW